jgi:SF-assemblin/beta giardin
MEDFVINLTGTVKKTVNEREKLSLLKDQMEDMSGDYETMRKAREEAKKQLDAKFADVYSKIQGTRDYVTDQGRQINEQLKDFQHHFQGELKSLKDFTSKTFEDEQNARESANKAAHERMDYLEKSILEEKKERIQQTEDMLLPIRNGLDALEKGFETEKNIRIEREKEILDTLDEEVKTMNERMDSERLDRVNKLQSLRDMIYNDINTQNNHIEKFKLDSMNALSDMKEGVETEMRSRLDHQDHLLDSLSGFIRTFQNTLKLIGKDV